MIQHPIENQTLDKILILLERFRLHGDQVRVDKASNLLKKIYNKQFIIGFSGHFSAGKSSMINELLGDHILPTSPIPTSANIVKIHRAQHHYAKIYYDSQKPLLFLEPYDFDIVKNYCKTGEVKEIEIGNQQAFLPEGTIVMDTPGIDSTDEAHRMSTESELHVADVVFYVMDYNHVQSELNFIYTKNLLKHGVRLYIIINQIDKHDENELSFQEFKQSVHESLATWDVYPERVFFTSLKNPTIKDNEFFKIQHLIREVFSHRDEWIDRTIETATDRLMEEHTHWLDEQLTHESDKYLNLIDPYPEEEWANFFHEEEQLKEKIVQLEQTIQLWEIEFKNGYEKILQNAYLMPYEIRQGAERFLLTKQPNFKVGFLFSKKKTDEERQQSLIEFSNLVRQQTESQITWHLKQYMFQQLNSLEISETQLHKQVQDLSITIQDALLDEIVKKGATFNSQYVLHYCESVSDQIKAIARTACRNIFTAVSKFMLKRNEAKATVLQESLEKTTKITSALRTLKDLQTTFEDRKAALSVPTGHEDERFSLLKEKWETEEKDVELYDGKTIESIGETQQRLENQQKIDNEIQYDIKELIIKINKVYQSLHNEKGFKNIAELLKTKADRLQNRTYTVALFGAFSAGKSSFANALIGEQVLPVSPNPTTATVNRICPTKESNDHKTANIHFKTKDVLLDDVCQSLAVFGVSCDSLEQACEQIPAILQRDDIDVNEKVHQSFLTAFYQGYQKYKNHLGTTMTTDLTQYRKFVGNENQSCFVDSIDLFYDADITRKNVTLVDTPGADSIHARHTDVAFEYIKNADAIFFVTYYNHAFSKADKEFLIQLGRVKDSFELDKMFFIINAMDLANNEDELNDVYEYVENELIRHGIRQPKIFTVSSKKALSDDSHNSHLNIVKEQFSYFIEHELSEIAVQSALADLQKVQHMLNELINIASENQAVKAEKKLALASTQKEIEQWIQSLDASIISERFRQEMEELLYYVKQRVFYRFPDFFKEAFHPSILSKKSKSGLTKALEELLNMMGYDFAQEMRATSLRLEKYAFALLQEQVSNIELEIQSRKDGLTFSWSQTLKIESLRFDTAFKEMDRTPFESTFKFFKDARSFFEQNEKKKMEEAMMTILTPQADIYIETHKSRMIDYYGEILINEFEQLKKNIQADMSDQFINLYEAYSDAKEAKKWIEIRSFLYVDDAL